MRCPTCDAPNPPANQHCQQCGAKLPSPQGGSAAEEEIEVVPVDSPTPAEPAERRPRRPARRRPLEEEEDTDLVRTFIPYKNPKALAAYYCGFFALIPGLGILLSVAAVVLGIQGVRYASDNPTAKGMAHAITGIVLGVMAFCCWNPIVLFLLWFNFVHMP
jgi:hypothetical protein